VGFGRRCPLLGAVVVTLLSFSVMAMYLGHSLSGLSGRVCLAGAQGVALLSGVASSERDDTDRELLARQVRSVECGHVRGAFPG
jgi:hypothetical protein